MIANKIKTVFLLGALSSLLLLLGNLLGGTHGLTAALIMALVMNFIVYFFSDRIVLNLYGAKQLDPFVYASIYDTVEELSGTMNLPMPKLWLVESDMANAFATGRNPKNASIAVTTGILRLLDHDELRGVLAHELSHIKNRDILVATIAATIATAIGYACNMLQHASFGATMSDNRSRKGNPIFMLVMAVVMPIIATMLQLAISRSREYLADETGAHSCHDPLALASALEKLEKNITHAHLNKNNTAQATTAPLFIVHPFNGQSLTSLFSTHPPIAQRIARLKQIHQKVF